MSEAKGDYLADDQRAVMARLSEVFTLGQMMALADAMGEALARHYGRVEIETRNGRVFIWAGRSWDCGKAKQR